MKEELLAQAQRVSDITERTNLARQYLQRQILASLADDDVWKRRFAEKRDVIRRLAREALEEDERGDTLPLDDLL